MYRWLPALLLLGAGTAQAQSLNFINGGGPLHGSNTSVVIQGEGSCSHHRQSPPTLGVGVGVQQPLRVPGTFGHGTALPTPSSVADSKPVGGVFFRIPLTKDSDKCKDFLAVQKAKARLSLARELHKNGAITDEKMASISREASELLN